jgi:hypothetical protein
VGHRDGLRDDDFSLAIAGRIENRRRCNAVPKRRLAPVSSVKWSWAGPPGFLMHRRGAFCLDVRKFAA